MKKCLLLCGLALCMALASPAKAKAQGIGWTACLNPAYGGTWYVATRWNGYYFQPYAYCWDIEQEGPVVFINWNTYFAMLYGSQSSPFPKGDDGD